MTELIPSVELDFEIAKAVGLEPLGIYTGWAPEGSFSWAEGELADQTRVVLHYSKLWPEWDCKLIHDGYDVDKLFHPDTYDRFHREFFAKFGHYTHCCAPAPEYSIDLNAALEAAQKVGLFLPEDVTNLIRTKYGWMVRGTQLYPADQETAALAICAAVIEKVKDEAQ